jgi:hypothetical protein
MDRVEDHQGDLELFAQLPEPLERVTEPRNGGSAVALDRGGSCVRPGELCLGPFTGEG